MRSRFFRAALLALVIGSTVGCDQLTKHVARTVLVGPRAIMLWGGAVHLALAHNTGGFLSIGASLPGPMRTALFVIGAGTGLLLAATYLVWRARLSPLAFLSAALMCAGGLSNLLDRALMDGRVTDFIVAGVGPLHTGVFNLADLAITAGCIGLALTAAVPTTRPPEHDDRKERLTAEAPRH